MTDRWVRRRSGAEAQTEALGRGLGAALLPGDLVALDGELGAGKTCFVRGLAAGAGLDGADVHSPTFVFHHVHRGSRLTLHHVDLYRLGPGADVSFLDLDGLLEEGAVAVEWAEYADLQEYRPAHVRIEAPGRDERVVAMRGDAPEHLLRALREAPTAS